MSNSTIVEVFHQQVTKYQERALFLSKIEGNYTAISWKDAAYEVKLLSLGLLALEVKPGDSVGLMMNTQANWPIWDLSILSALGVNVPIYATNKGPQIAHIINDSASRILVVGSQELANEVLLYLNLMPKLCYLIVPESKTWKLQDKVNDVTIMTFEEVKGLGMAMEKVQPELYQQTWSQGQAEDIVSLIYTSGTTGNPKGVILTHNNFISNVQACQGIVPSPDNYVSLSFLPLSHVLERTAGWYYMMFSGITIAFAESINEVPTNLMEIRPQVMVSVPRLFEKIHHRIMENVVSSSNIKKWIFNWAMKIGKKRANLAAQSLPIPTVLSWQNRLADKLVFAPIREKFGGRLDFCISGGAPLGRDLAEFFFTIGIKVLEGYGMTETSPVITCNTRENYRFGSVGRTIPGVSVKLSEDGEILVKGPNVCKGYYNNPVATTELFTEDGWLQTGDIGSFTEEGFLYITDRKKDLIITAGGKNVAPQVLEQHLTADRYIAQAIVYGDRQPFLVAMIVPDFTDVSHYAHEKGLTYTSQQELICLPEIRQLLAQRVTKALQDQPNYEQVKRILLRDQEFTLEAEEITPTLKIRRRKIYSKYQTQFLSMYNEGGLFIEVNSEFRKNQLKPNSGVTLNQ